MFQIQKIPENYRGAIASIIQPSFDPPEAGVNFTDATLEGLVAVYKHGQHKGQDFLTFCLRSASPS